MLLRILIILFISTPLLSQTVIAHYPLVNDVDDATGNNGPITLFGNNNFGNPNPPAVPSNGTFLCTNGYYIYQNTFDDGQAFISPNISNVDIDDFEISLDFFYRDFVFSGSPSSNFFYGSPLMVIGPYRWLIIGVNLNGSLTFGMNNTADIVTTPKILNLNQWYNIIVKHKNGVIELIIDNELYYTDTIDPFITGPNNAFNFTSTNFSNGRCFDGCWRDFKLSSSTILGQFPLSQCPSSYAGPNAISGIVNYDTNYKTDGIIESEQLIKSSVNSEYSSGVIISLNPGFETELGSQFVAILDGCY